MIKINLWGDIFRTSADNSDTAFLSLHSQYRPGSPIVFPPFWNPSFDLDHRS